MAYPHWLRARCNASRPSDGASGAGSWGGGRCAPRTRRIRLPLDGLRRRLYRGLAVRLADARRHRCSERDRQGLARRAWGAGGHDGRGRGAGDQERPSQQQLPDPKNRRDVDGSLGGCRDLFAQSAAQLAGDRAADCLRRAAGETAALGAIRGVDDGRRPAGSALACARRGAPHGGAAVRGRGIRRGARPVPADRNDPRRRQPMVRRGVRRLRGVDRAKSRGDQLRRAHQRCIPP